MAVFRVEKTRDSTIMANHHLKNRELSLKAKGLLSMMLSLPEAWNYTTRGLAAICMEGVDSIGSALRELERAGYIVRNRLRDERGRITDTEYIIYETPRKTAPETPELSAPDTPAPYTENPDMETADMENTDVDMPHLPSPDAAQPYTENPYMDAPHMDAPYTGSPVQYNTYPKNTDKSKINPENPYPSNPNPSNGELAADVRARVRENIGYDCLATDENRERLDGIVELITETLCSGRDTIRIAGVDYPAGMVRERLLQLNSLHIQYVFECLENTTSHIRNIRQYLLATLFNAPVTKGSYYDALVRRDRALGCLWPPVRAAQV